MPGSRRYRLADDSLRARAALARSRPPVWAMQPNPEAGLYIYEGVAPQRGIGGRRVSRETSPVAQVRDAVAQFKTALNPYGDAVAQFKTALGRRR